MDRFDTMQRNVKELLDFFTKLLHFNHIETGYTDKKFQFKIQGNTGVGVG